MECEYKQKEDEELGVQEKPGEEYDKQHESTAAPTNTGVTTTHFNILVGVDDSLVGHKRIASISDLKVDMWVLVSYDSKIYVGQVMSIHPDAPKVGDSARIKCLNKQYGDMDPEHPQDFEPLPHWIIHPINNIYECPVRVQKVMKNRKVLWKYQCSDI